MDKMTFREAQLLVIGAEALKGRNVEFVTLNNLQTFKIGDVIEVVEIRLDTPCVVARTADGPESYINVEMLSEKVVDECIEILREVAFYVDEFNEHV